jgi:hypothetical protein
MSESGQGVEGEYAAAVAGTAVALPRGWCVGSLSRSVAVVKRQLLARRHIMTYKEGQSGIARRHRTVSAPGSGEHT